MGNFIGHGKIFLSAFILFVSVSISAGDFGHASGHGDSIPFRPGEKINFIVKWSFIPAAEATLEILPLTRLDGIPSYHFVMTAKTYPYVDLFYMVRKRVDAFVDAGITRSLLYKIKEDGKSKRDITVHFDWSRNVAQYSNFGESLEPIPILPGSFDPLSVFYAFRRFDLSESLGITAPVTDGKKCVTGTAKVKKRETVKVGGTYFDTYLVEPDLRHIGGVFRKSKDAKLQIWVTADSRRIPVKIKSKVVVGSFVAELVSFNPGGN